MKKKYFKLISLKLLVVFLSSFVCYGSTHKNNLELIENIKFISTKNSDYSTFESENGEKFNISFYSPEYFDSEILNLSGQEKVYLEYNNETALTYLHLPSGKKLLTLSYSSELIGKSLTSCPGLSGTTRDIIHCYNDYYTALNTEYRSLRAFAKSHLPENKFDQAIQAMKKHEEFEELIISGLKDENWLDGTISSAEVIMDKAVWLQQRKSALLQLIKKHGSSVGYYNFP